jgi:hypothetical protein
MCVDETVNVMKECSLDLFSCKRETVYGKNLNYGKYTFFKSDGCDKEYSYDCKLHNLGPLKKDNLKISATIYWSK